MTPLRLFGAIIFILLSIFFALINAAILVENIRNRKRGIGKHLSMVPGLSVFCAAGAFLIYPDEPKVWILVIPTFDIGNWVIILGLPLAMVIGHFRRTQTETGSHDNPVDNDPPRAKQ